MAISNHASEAEQSAEVERVWREFWLPIVGRPDGTIDMEQVKRELHDLHMVIDHCERIYDYASRGRVSKFNTLPEVVIEIAEHFRSQEIGEAVKEATEVTRLDSLTVNGDFHN